METIPSASASATPTSEQQPIVAKFGGTSLATASQIRKVIDIIKADQNRRYIVVSAPGKRSKEDTKITDLLYQLYAWSSSHGKCEEHYQKSRGMISDRFCQIVSELGLSEQIDIAAEMREIDARLDDHAKVDYAASRGEYLMGKILAAALGKEFEFVDPADCIFFNEKGRFNNAYEGLGTLLEGRKAVIPGFYGAMPDKIIKTFPRGGSDITGAIIARAVRACRYENWTDVCGLLMADPNIVENPEKIEFITYSEVRELTYRGATVFHEEAMFPVAEARIRTYIRNTNQPQDSGTCIVPDTSFFQQNCKENRSAFSITGIAGKCGFTVITVKKAMMNQEVGFVRKILTILEKYNISFEHMPGGIDSVSFVIETKALQDKTVEITGLILKECSPDQISTYKEMAIIATVGHALDSRPGVAATLCAALASRSINILMINQGLDGINIIVGVADDDFENAVSAIYERFVKKEILASHATTVVAGGADTGSATIRRQGAVEVEML